MTVLNRTYVNGGTAPADIKKQLGYDAHRRSLYLPVVRTDLHDFLAAFDYPDPSLLTGRRDSTTVAPQALFLMNSPFVQQCAAAFAARVQPLGEHHAARVAASYRLAFGRRPSDTEISAALAFLAAESQAMIGDPQAAAWTRLCHALLASNEFLYVR
jgi:hypothetical protein